MPQPSYTASGEYSFDLRSAVMAAGLGNDSEIYHFRWTSAAALCLVREVRMWAGCDTTAFTAGFFSFRLFAARAWTANGTGGAGVTPAGNDFKLRTAFGTTVLGSVRIATTAGLTAGTKTLDAQALGSTGGGIPAVAGTPFLPSTTLFKAPTRGSAIVLTANEGLSILAFMPATGTWAFGVTVAYEEAAIVPLA